MRLELSFYTQHTDRSMQKQTYQNSIKKCIKRPNKLNRELANTILNSMIKDRKEGAAGVVPLIFALILCAWSYCFLAVVS